MSIFFLRRFGGVQRIIIVAFAVAAGIYVIQSIMLNLLAPAPKRASERTLEDGATATSFEGMHRINDIKVVVPQAKTAGQTQYTAPPQPTLSPYGRTYLTFLAICGVYPACAADQLTYNLSAVLADSAKPKACINNLMIFSLDKVAKGLNVIVIEEKQKTVQDIKYFDFSSSDREFVTYMLEVARGRVVLISSWADFATKLSLEGRELLKDYGSLLAGNLTIGQSFVMIGQQGLEPGFALEANGQATSEDPLASTSLAGCLAIPLGPLVPLPFVVNQGELPKDHKQMPSVISDVVYGSELPHCGRKDPCAAGEFPVFVYSGKNKDDFPQICINGRFVISRDVNKAGRGLNIAVLKSSADEVLRVGHFDTYEEDSSALEIFLEGLEDGEIIIVVTFDEAFTRLSNMAKQLFNELGSSLIQSMQFRSSWYFIGQKGINGISPFEELYHGFGKDWATPINKRLCVPITLLGQMGSTDPTTAFGRNYAKRLFCSKYDGYEDFCDAPVDNLLLNASHPIFSVPLLIVAGDKRGGAGQFVCGFSGLAHNSLRLCLETVLQQAGVNTSSVLVTFDENYPESSAVAELFGILAWPMLASSTYSAIFSCKIAAGRPSRSRFESQCYLIGLVSKSLEAVWIRYPDADAAIVIEEDLLLTNDFLFYMAQLWLILQTDPTVLAISAWNENGFAVTSSLPDTVYRVEGFPGLGFMITKAVYLEHIANRSEQCCSKRAWNGWNVSQPDGVEPQIIVPDVSRVFRRNAEGLGVLEPHVYDLFRRPRIYNIDQYPILSNVDSLDSANYDLLIANVLNLSIYLNYDDFLPTRCQAGHPETVLGEMEPAGMAYAVVFEQYFQADWKRLTPLLQCFGLYYSPSMAPRGVYKGVLRFSFKQNHFSLVGSKSTFFQAAGPDHFVETPEIATTTKPVSVQRRTAAANLLFMGAQRGRPGVGVPGKTGPLENRQSGLNLARRIAAPRPLKSNFALQQRRV